MRFHLPKPLHGWREFIGEVGIIVLGVLIALGLEQVVENWRWQHDVRDAQRALGEEITFSLFAGIERMRAQYCVERRLDAVDEALEIASRTGRLPPVAPIEVPPFRLWTDGTWQSTLSSQAASHFSRDQLNKIAFVYTFVNRENALNDEEVRVWSELSAIVGPGRPIGAPEEASLRAAAGRARMLNREIAILGLRLTQRASALHLPLNRATLEQARTKPLEQGIIICKPRATAVPQKYGNAPWGDMLEEVDTGLKNIPLG